MYPMKNIRLYLLSIPRKRLLLVGLTLVVIVLLCLAPAWRSRAKAREEERVAAADLKAGSLGPAEDQWFAAITTWPADANAYSDLGDLYRTHGEPEVAGSCYRRLLKIAPRFPHIYCRLAAAAESDRAHLEAYDDAQRELQLDPDCPRALGLLATFDKRLGKTVQARAEAEHAYRVGPGDEQVALTYAEFFLPKDPDGAVAILAKAVPQHPDSWRLTYLLGYCYSRSAVDPQGAEKALPLLRRAEVLAPQEGTIHTELCRLLRLQNQVSDSVKEGALAVRYSPYKAESFSEYYLSLMRAGLKDEANKINARSEFLRATFDRQKTLQERYKTSPGDLGVLHELVNVDEQLGDLNGALVLSQTALAAHPQNQQLQQDYHHFLAAASGR